MVFVELSVVEVHDFEIVIGRLPAASGATVELGSFATYALKISAFGP